jgi:protein gp37
MGLDAWGKNKPRTIRVDAAIRELRRIDKRAAAGQRLGVFSGSMCDIFEEHPTLDNPPFPTEDSPRRAYLLAAQLAINVDVMLLTKRPENIAAMALPSWMDRGIARLLPPNLRGGLPWPRHVWVGATIASPGEERMAGHLAYLKSLGAITFASVEPMLGEGPTPGAWLRSVDLVIIGGESGGGARAFDVGAAQRLVNACDNYGSKVWFKQMGSRWAQANPGALRKGASHGQDPYRWPAWARRREMPESDYQAARAAEEAVV